MLYCANLTSRLLPYYTLTAILHLPALYRASLCCTALTSLLLFTPSLLLHSYSNPTPPPLYSTLLFSTFLLYSRFHSALLSSVLGSTLRFRTSTHTLRCATLRGGISLYPTILHTLGVLRSTSFHTTLRYTSHQRATLYMASCDAHVAYSDMICHTMGVTCGPWRSIPSSALLYNDVARLSYVIPCGTISHILGDWYVCDALRYIDCCAASYYTMLELSSSDMEW